jgi:hypothetical protein
LQSWFNVSGNMLCSLRDADSANMLHICDSL